MELVWRLLEIVGEKASVEIEMMTKMRRAAVELIRNMSAFCFARVRIILMPKS